MTLPSTEVWRELSADQLAVAYSPSSTVADFHGALDRYAEESAAVRSRISWKEYSYGPHEHERLDYFPASIPNSPVLMFFHGGYWQQLGKSDASFPAAPCRAAGIAYAAIGYGLAPDHSIEAIVRMAWRAVEWVHRNARHLGANPDRIFVSGSSAGAHLALMSLLEYGHASREFVRGVIALSGIYDLEPLVDTYINDALRMDTQSARRNSPLHRMYHNALPPLIVARGQNETTEFVRQHHTFVSFARAFGIQVTDLVAPKRNHFDNCHDLCRSGTLIGHHTLGMTGPGLYPAGM